jgi:hypothetical protein
MPFLNFRKNAKIMRKWDDFREISFRKNFRKNEHFRENLTKISRKQKIH